MDRQPGSSVRLRLTLSYAGFLLLTGGLLLAVVWVFLLRYVPDRAGLGVPGFGPTRSDLLDAFAPRAAEMLRVIAACPRQIALLYPGLVESETPG